ALRAPSARCAREWGTRQKVSVFKVRERREPFGLSLRPSRWLWRSGLAFSRWTWNFRKKASGLVPTANGEANRDIVVRNVCDRDRRGPRRGGNRRVGLPGHDVAR